MNSSISLSVYLTLHAVSLYLILPLVAAKYFFQCNFHDLGLVFPKWDTKNIVLILFAIALLVPFGYLLGHQPECKNFYSRSLGMLSLPEFILAQVLLLPAFYIAEEFFFRGFLFLSLWEKIGWHSFWVTDLLFVYAHLLKPLPELILSIPVGILLSYLALKTKSIFPSFVTHLLLGILLNVVVYLNM